MIFVCMYLYVYKIHFLRSQASIVSGGMYVCTYYINIQIHIHNGESVSGCCGVLNVGEGVGQQVSRRTHNF